MHVLLFIDKKRTTPMLLIKRLINLIETNVVYKLVYTAVFMYYVYTVST